MSCCVRLVPNQCRGSVLLINLLGHRERGGAGRSTMQGQDLQLRIEQHMCRLTVGMPYLEEEKKKRVVVSVRGSLFKSKSFKDYLCIHRRLSDLSSLESWPVKKMKRLKGSVY